MPFHSHKNKVNHGHAADLLKAFIEKREIKANVKYNP